MSVTLWDQEMPIFFSATSAPSPSPMSLRAAMTMKTARTVRPALPKLVEPTESETKETLDAAVDVLIRIHDEAYRDPEKMF